MRNTKFQGHRPFGSREEDFLWVLPYMGMAAILVMLPGPFEQTFVPPPHGNATWNLVSFGPVVSEEKTFKECGRQTDRRRRPTYPISSSVSLRLRWTNKDKWARPQVLTAFITALPKCLLQLRLAFDADCKNGYNRLKKNWRDFIAYLHTLWWILIYLGSMNPENTSFSSDPETCYYIFLLSRSYLSTTHFHDG